MREYSKTSSLNLADRRVQKTRQQLQEALMDLTALHGYASITVQQIIDQANVGRTTFYAHFQNKNQLLQSCLEELDHLLAKRTEQLTSSQKSKREPGVILGILLFIQENHQFIKALTRRGDALSRLLYDCLAKHAESHLDLLTTNQEATPKALTTHYFVGSFIGMLDWWIANDMPCNPEIVQQHWQALAQPSFKGVLGR